MVAKVISGKNIRGILNYNENKVKEGMAECIMANRFGSEPADLSFSNKLNRFQKLLEQNAKTKTNAIHISLNFDMPEKLGIDLLKQIALVYMDKIGFGDQPYLVYEHRDAAHPHIHIVTTNIQDKGKRIDIHNIGRNESEKARKEIELSFGLVVAQAKKKTNASIQLVSAEKAVYGKSETKRSITNIVRFVTRSYRYTSMPELNAVLRQFNVTADRGKEGSWMYEKNGLLYSLTDKHGNRVGVPIKASAIYGKPTLTFLEKQFHLNRALRQPFREHLKICVNRSLSRTNPVSRPAFIEALKKQGIVVFFRENTEGRVYGITFVDNTFKVVFNGSDLGKNYGAQAILQKLDLAKQETRESSAATSAKSSEDTTDTRTELGFEQAVKELTEARQFDFSSTASDLKRRKKKKKKGRSI